MMRIAATVVIVVAACGGGGGSDDAELDQHAQEAFLSDYSASLDLQQQALAAAPARVADAVKTLSYTGPCLTAGTGTVTGVYDEADGNGANVTFSVDVVLAGCNDGDGTVDGSEHWTKVVDPIVDDFEMLDGTITYDGPTYAGTFEYHVTIRIDSSAGTIEYTGTYKVNGISYTIDRTAWGTGF